MRKDIKVRSRSCRFNEIIEMLKSILVKKITIWTPLLGGSTILDVSFLIQAIFFIHNETEPYSNNFYIFSQYGQKIYFSKYWYAHFKDDQTS